MGSPGLRGCSAVRLYSVRLVRLGRGGEGKATCVCLIAGRLEGLRQNQQLAQEKQLTSLGFDMWPVTVQKLLVSIMILRKHLLGWRECK